MQRNHRFLHGLRSRHEATFPGSCDLFDGPGI